MKARNGISIFRRHRSFSRPFSNCQSRLTSNNCEPFVLPRLVIDLDAADSTLVKRWEDIKSEENSVKDAPLSKGSHNQRDRRRGAKPVRSRIGESQKPPQIGPLMPRDVLSFAALGHAVTQQLSDTRASKNIYRRCGIREHDSDEVIVQQLAAIYSADLPPRPMQAGLGQNVREDLKRLIETCKEFFKLKRTVAMLSSTTEGCHFLVQHGKSILQGIRLCRFASRNESVSQQSMVSCSMVLKLLNNLKISVESKGIDMGSDFCNAGIYYASKIPSLPAIRQYLMISLHNSYPANLHTALGLMELQQRCQTGWEEVEKPLQHASCKDVLTLITGLGEDCGTRQMMARDISFASLLYGQAGQGTGFDVDPRLYFTYIQGLGDLGRADALSEEFRIGKIHLPQSVRSEKHRVYVARAFALACTAAGDLTSALSILQTVHPFQESKASDEEDASRRHNHYRWLVSALDTHYRSHNLSPTKKLRDKIEQEFRNLPSDPDQTIGIFESFIAKKALLNENGATVPAGNLICRQI